LAYHTIYLIHLFITLAIWGAFAPGAKTCMLAGGHRPQASASCCYAKKIQRFALEIDFPSVKSSTP